MSKVIIEIEDLPNDKVKITSTPNFETMMKMDISGEGLSGCHGYAFSLLNHARKLAQQSSPIIREIPRLKGKMFGI
jgi:hypothetical protein